VDSGLRRNDHGKIGRNPPVIASGELSFFLAVLIDGVMAGAIYALIALAFVLVYKCSRMVNFAVGEWLMVGALIAGLGYSTLGLGAAGAALFAAGAMAVLGLAFNGLVVRRLAAGPVISLIMVTLGLGALMRGLSTLLFSGIPAGVPLPIPVAPVLLGGIPIASEKLVAAATATAAVAIVAWLYGHTRTGLALRAIADDRQAAAAVGIDVGRHFGLVWALTGIVSVCAGLLWVLVAGGGFGVAVVGLKVFPIVVIGGLDSIPGTIVAAVLIGMVESLGSGYLDPLLGGGFGTMASYLMLLAMLMVRPNGLFGRPPAVRV
jgi:branched-chain amino acid transport system permease protein